MPQSVEAQGPLSFGFTTRGGFGDLATGTTFDVGWMRVHILDDGVFVTDAGNLFGGSRKASIKGAMHPVLVEAGDDLVLIDAGFGPELPELLVGRYELRRDKNLLDHLDRAGYAAGDVTHVILSHLDADHVGWALGPPSFPDATVYVQVGALEEARQMPEKDGRRAAVPAIEKGVEDGWCELLDTDGDVLQGVRVEVRAGHSAGHQIVWIGEGEDLALYTGDLAPAKIWLNPDLISGVDTDPEAARQNRIEVLSAAESRDAPVILYHEPGDCLVKVRKTEDGFEAIPIGE
jgi:glyoxylase-like metal-dependent hydrolase (beta-lactamase superfamily II)